MRKLTIAACAVLCLMGTSTLALADEGSRYGDQIQPGAKSSPAAKTITRKVLRVEGDTVFIKRQDGQETRVHVDRTTQMGKSIEPGEPVEVKLNDQNHALSILSGPAVTDRRNDKE